MEITTGRGGGASPVRVQQVLVAADSSRRSGHESPEGAGPQAPHLVPAP